MQTKHKSDKINPCKCGFKPDHFTIGYGRTPYSIWCPICKKSTNMNKCLVTGHHSHIIDYWNEHVSKLTTEELSLEYKKFMKEKDKNTGYDMYDIYEYYWEKEKGEVLYARCCY